MEEESEEFDPQLYATKTPMQVFFSEFCKKFHNNYSKEHLLVVASVCWNR